MDLKRSLSGQWALVIQTACFGFVATVMGVVSHSHGIGAMGIGSPCGHEGDRVQRWKGAIRRLGIHPNTYLCRYVHDASARASLAKKRERTGGVPACFRDGWLGVLFARNTTDG